MNRLVIAFAVLATAVACHKVSEDSPTSSSSTSTSTATASGTQPSVVIVPAQVPTPAPAAAATPTPVPASTPTPAPQKALGCGVGKGTGPGDDCPREGGPDFLEDVEAALDQVVREHPEAFDLKDGGPCGTCYRVVNERVFEAGVIKALEQRGLCAVGGEEFGVKINNDYNEQYDLLTSSMHIRRQLGSWRGTCRPAAF